MEGERFPSFQRREDRRNAQGLFCGHRQVGSIRNSGPPAVNNAASGYWRHHPIGPIWLDPANFNFPLSTFHFSP
jgi:hypothetical protein